MARKTLAQLNSNPRGYPCCTSYLGGVIKLSADDIQAIEDLAAIGGKVDMIAVELGVTASSFKAAAKDNSRIQEAIKRGRARDEYEYRQALREAALTMASPSLTIWHGKQAYGMSEKIHSTSDINPVIMINTGVPGPALPGIEPDSLNNSDFIEHDDND
ncbi:MAG: hypothetical protein KAG18_06680 [Sinobacterium sp.]|nr:hypothetical protein [Sinobacterium sp.]